MKVALVLVDVKIPSTAYACLHRPIYVTGHMQRLICTPHGVVQPLFSRMFSRHRVVSDIGDCSAQPAGMTFTNNPAMVARLNSMLSSSMLNCVPGSPTVVVSRPKRDSPFIAPTNSVREGSSTSSGMTWQTAKLSSASSAKYVSASTLTKHGSLLY